MSVGSFFKSVFSKLGHALGIVKRLIPDVVFDAAVDKVESLANEQISGADKRDKAVAFLISKFPGLPEYVVRLAVELAVARLKDEIAKVADKAREV